jgi:hypothetical protein
MVAAFLIIQLLSTHQVLSKIQVRVDSSYCHLPALTKAEAPVNGEWQRVTLHLECVQ